MKKTIKIGMAAMLMLTMAFSTTNIVFADDKVAESVSLNSNETAASSFTFDASTGTITRFTGSETSVVIPSVINGVSVKEIGISAFEGALIESVYIPGSVKKIGKYAFIDCYELAEITLNEGLEEIDEGAFSFNDAVTEINIPSTVKTIGKAAISSDSELAKITVASGNKNYSAENGVLYNKDKSVLIKYPDGKSDTKYTVNSNTKEIMEHAFEDSIVQNVVLPNGINTIGECAFYNSTKLKSINFPSSLKNIRQSAFLGCLALTSIDLNNSIENIEDSAFSRCNGLTQITIPSGLKSFGTSVFSNCIGLKSVAFENGITTIPAGTFSKCSGITNVTIPDGVTLIENGAFNGCTALGRVVLPEGIIKLDTNVFGGCTSLSKINLPDSLQTIESAAFMATALTDVVIPSQIKVINSETFVYCDKLKSVSFPSGIQSINLKNFESCTALTDVYCYAGTVADNSELYPKGVSINYKGLFTNSPKLFEHSLNKADWTATTLANGKKALQNGTKTATVDVNADGIVYMELAAPGGKLVVKNNGNVVATVGSSYTVDNPYILCAKLNDSKSNKFTFEISGSSNGLISNMRVADKGDANLDGKIDLADAVAAKALVAKSNGDKLAIAVAKDNISSSSVTNYDVARLMREIAGLK